MVEEERVHLAVLQAAYTDEKLAAIERGLVESIDSTLTGPSSQPCCAHRAPGEHRSFPEDERSVVIRLGISRTSFNEPDAPKPGQELVVSIQSVEFDANARKTQRTQAKSNAKAVLAWIDACKSMRIAD